jgi:hypothetical protein
VLDTYKDTFIQVATDSPADSAREPKPRGDKKTVAQLEHEMLWNHPYEFTQDELQFAVYMAHKNIPKSQEAAAKEEYFSVPHACLRASPLAKTHGWGFHFNAEGKVALVPLGSDQYKMFAADDKLQQVFAMRSKRA